jgi:DNA-directed RNA polymerase subunit M/transcription elongation factor TFIIS
MDRQVAKVLLAKALGSGVKAVQNAGRFEEYIYSAVKDSSDDKIYVWSLYQVIGLLLTEKDRKSVAKSVKDGRVGWKSPTFDKVSARINEFDEYLVRPFEVVEGVIECGKCHSKRTWCVQRQVRSCDEPMTTFSRCVDCGNQWVYSG